jgi:hypothetical protein
MRLGLLLLVVQGKFWMEKMFGWRNDIDGLIWDRMGQLGESRVSSDGMVEECYVDIWGSNVKAEYSWITS